jgi:hypothetical protein
MLTRHAPCAGARAHIRWRSGARMRCALFAGAATCPVGRRRMPRASVARRRACRAAVVRPCGRLTCGPWQACPLWPMAGRPSAPMVRGPPVAHWQGRADRASFLTLLDRASSVRLVARSVAGRSESAGRVGVAGGCKGTSKRLRRRRFRNNEGSRGGGKGGEGREGGGMRGARLRVRLGFSCLGVVAQGCHAEVLNQLSDPTTEHVRADAEAAMEQVGGAGKYPEEPCCTTLS